MSSAALLDGVTKHFGAVTALDDVSFAVGPGEVVALLGPNGAGKSTALAVLLGLRSPDDGRARLNGLDPRRPAARLDVGVALQASAFPTTLRVRELVAFVQAHYPERTTDLPEAFELEALGDRQLGGLSGGEGRRVAVALAFAGRPKLVVLDEPTAGLDGESRQAVWRAVRAHVSAGRSALLTTHYLEEAEALAGRVVLLAGGVVVADESVAALKASAGLTRVGFRASPSVTIAGATRDGDRVALLTPDAGAAVARLVHNGVALVDLEVRPLTLEEAIATRVRRR